MKKRVCSWLLALTFLLAMMPSGAFAAETDDIDSPNDTVQATIENKYYPDKRYSYSTLEAAIAEYNKKKEEEFGKSDETFIALQQDITLGENDQIEVYNADGINLTLDMNGHSITKLEGNDYAIVVGKKATVTIRDSRGGAFIKCSSDCIKYESEDTTNHIQDVDVTSTQGTAITAPWVTISGSSHVYGAKYGVHATKMITIDYSLHSNDTPVISGGTAGVYYTGTDNKPFGLQVGTFQSKAGVGILSEHVPLVKLFSELSSGKLLPIYVYVDKNDNIIDSLADKNSTERSSPSVCSVRRIDPAKDINVYIKSEEMLDFSKLPVSIVYNGKQPEFEARLGTVFKLDQTDLAPYSIEADDKFDKGEHALTVTFAKNFSFPGNLEITYTIDPRPLKIQSITARSKTYDGSAEIVVTDITLDDVISGDDVRVEFDKAVVEKSDVGTYDKIRLIGAKLIGEKSSNYYLDYPTDEEITFTYDENDPGVEITPYPLDASHVLEVEAPAEIPYTGSVTRPDFRVTLTHEAKPAWVLVEGTDYTVTFAPENPTACGEYTATIQTNGTNFTGQLTAKHQFTIVPAELSVEDIEVTPDTFVYDGTEKRPVFKVTVSGQELAEGTDYEIEGTTAATEVGTYTATVKGKGNYTGEVVVTFTITPQGSTGPDISGGISTGGASHVVRTDLSKKQETRYDIHILRTKNGSVTADRTSAAAGQTVTLRVSPDDGYQTADLTVACSSDGALVRTRESQNEITFTMPKDDVTVEAVFEAVQTEEPAHDCPSAAYPDLDTSQWYHEAADYVLENGLMSGSGDRFTPDGTLSRAMLVQILYNHAGRPQTDASSRFADVPAGEWYTAAVNWAAGAGIVSGGSDGNFAPDSSITREQFAVMLWNYSGRPASQAELQFADAADANAYARPALCWAAENGILSGKTFGRLDPQGSTTRAEAAQLLKNCFDK